MGGYFVKQRKHFNEEILDEEKDFSITFKLYTDKKIQSDQQKKILEYLQYSNPLLSYMNGNTIILLYKPRTLIPMIRSNIVCDLITHISAEFATWIAKNTDIDLRLMNIYIESDEYENLLKDLKNVIITAKLRGIIHNEKPITLELLDELK